MESSENQDVAFPPDAVVVDDGDTLAPSDEKMRMCRLSSPQPRESQKGGNTPGYLSLGTRHCFFSHRTARPRFAARSRRLRRLG